MKEALTRLLEDFRQKAADQCSSTYDSEQIMSIELDVAVRQFCETWDKPVVKSKAIPVEIAPYYNEAIPYTHFDPEMLLMWPSRRLNISAPLMGVTVADDTPLETVYE